MKNKVSPAWMQGLILALICIVFGLIVFFTGQIKNRALGWFQYIILLGFVIWACINYAKQMEGNVTFGNVFGFGFKVTAATAAILSVYTFIALKFIYPEMIEISMAEARKSMEAKNNISADQIDSSLEMIRRNFVLIAVVGILFGTAILGLIASLIGAGVAKKNPNYNPLEQS